MIIKVIKIFLGSDKMKLIVGLGNPGKEYEKTRHNVGFMIIDNFLNNNDWKKKFDGLYQIMNIGKEKVIFLKPLTFMNNSGLSVSKIVKFYDIAIEDILVVQDDLDIPLGKFKLKANSSSGGHNGIKSIIASLGSDKFSRLKIGISNEKRVDTINHVLGKFNKLEMNCLEENLLVFNDIIVSFIEKGIAKTMNQYNR